jgi:hypothetical protein
MQLKHDINILSRRMNRPYSSVHNDVAAKQEEMGKRIADLDKVRTVRQDDSDVGALKQQSCGILRDNTEDKCKFWDHIAEAHSALADQEYRVARPCWTSREWPE